MKRIISVFLVSVLCLALFCSCQSQPEGAPDGMKAVESSDKLDYNLYIPAHWTQDLSTGVVSAYVNNSDLSNISMMQGNNEKMEKLDTIVEEYIKNLSSNIGLGKDENGKLTDTFKMAEGYPEKCTLNGVEARKLQYSATVSGADYTFMQIICSKGGSVYYFTYTALTDNFETNMEDVQKVIDNFAFKKK